MFFVPAGGADDHVLAGFDAGFDVGEDAVGSGEVDDGVDVVEFFGVSAAQAAFSLAPAMRDVMFALGGDFRYQRSGFAAA